MCFQQAETNTSGRWHRKSSSSAAMSWFSGTISASGSRRREKGAGRKLGEKFVKNEQKNKKEDVFVGAW